MSLFAVPARPVLSAEPRMDADRADELIMELATADDDTIRAELRGRAIEAWLPLARLLADRYTGRGEPADDLVQVAIVGLITAIDRFTAVAVDLGSAKRLAVHWGADFAAYAVPAIVAELRRHLRDHGQTHRNHRRQLALRPAIDTLSQLLGRSPTVTDIAAYLGASEEDVLDELEANWGSPIDAHIAAGVDPFSDEDSGFAQAELRATLARAMAGLDVRERLIVNLRFNSDSTQAQIAEQVGVSQVHVSRLLTKALGKLRGQLGTRAA